MLANFCEAELIRVRSPGERVLPFQRGDHPLETPFGAHEESSTFARCEVLVEVCVCGCQQSTKSPLVKLGLKVYEGRVDSGDIGGARLFPVVSQDKCPDGHDSGGSADVSVRADGLEGAEAKSGFAEGELALPCLCFREFLAIRV